MEHQINCEILEEAKMEPSAMVMGRRTLELFGHLKRIHDYETENIRAAVEMHMERMHQRKPILRHYQKGHGGLGGQG